METSKVCIYRPQGKNAWVVRVCRQGVVHTKRFHLDQRKEAEEHEDYLFKTFPDKFKTGPKKGVPQGPRFKRYPSSEELKIEGCVLKPAESGVRCKKSRSFGGCSSYEICLYEVCKKGWPGWKDIR